jgi:hypothetical protein
MEGPHDVVIALRIRIKASQDFSDVEIVRRRFEPGIDHPLSKKLSLDRQDRTISGLVAERRQTGSPLHPEASITRFLELNPGASGKSGITAFIVPGNEGVPEHTGPIGRDEQVSCAGRETIVVHNHDGATIANEAGEGNCRCDISARAADNNKSPFPELGHRRNVNAFVERTVKAKNVASRVEGNGPSDVTAAIVCGAMVGSKVSVLLLGDPLS